MVLLLGNNVITRIENQFSYTQPTFLSDWQWIVLVNLFRFRNSFINKLRRKQPLFNSSKKTVTWDLSFSFVILQTFLTTVSYFQITLNNHDVIEVLLHKLHLRYYVEFIIRKSTRKQNKACVCVCVFVYKKKEGQWYS